MIYEPKLPLTPFTTCRLKWKGRDGNTYKYRRRDNPNIRVSISTYVGSIGAMHYYGRVKGNNPDVYCVEENKYYSLGGYGDDKPELYGVFEFDARRVLTEIEEDMSGETIGDIGDTTQRFNTPEEAFRAAIKSVRESFADTKTRHWVVQFEYCGPKLEDKEFRLNGLDKALNKFMWEGR